jgi:regulator of protease activity HflC (stomatin/prohibitin superfamily)
MDIIGLSGTNIFFVVFGIFTLILIYTGIQNVDEGNVRLVERLGKYHKTLRPGINFTLPGIDRVRKDFELYTFHEEKGVDAMGKDLKGTKRVDFSNSRGDISVKEQMIDPIPFETIAADNAVVNPDILCYFTIIDAHKAVYNVDNLGEQLLKLIETTIRQEIGRQNSDDLITSRQQIGATVQKELEKATEPWGTKINRVEIQEIKFKESIQEKLVELLQPLLFF